MTYQQIVEKRNTLMAEAGRIAQGKNITTETRAKVTAMLAEADTLAEDARIQKALDDHQNEIRSAGRPGRPEIGAANDAEQSKLAFRSWMATGAITPENRTYLRETRDLGATVGVGIGTNTITSSVLVPVTMDPILAAAKKSYGAVLNAVRTWNTPTSEPAKVALYDDTEQLFTPITENTAVSENDPNLSGFVSYTDPQTGGLVRVSQQLIGDSNWSIDAFIAEIMGRRLYAGLSKQVMLGNGSHIAAIGANVPVGAVTAANTGIDANSLVAAIGALDPAYQANASWLMAPATRMNLMLLKDNYGHSLLQPDATGAPFSSIYGAPIVLTPYAPAVAPGAVPVLFGDLTSYTLRVVGNLEIVRLVERWAEFDEVGFIGRLRGAGGYSTLQAVSPAIIGIQVHA